MFDESQEFEDGRTAHESRGETSRGPSDASDNQSTEWPGLEMEATADLGDRGAKPRLTDGTNNWPSIDGYVIEQYLGGGGFGDVFKAHWVKLGGPVAIKILQPQHSLDETVTQRFQKEVQAAALTRHTHVVQILDTDISTEPPYENCRYLVTEYLPGGDFAQWLKRHSGAAANLEATVRMLIGVCRGLEAIHRNGIVHRDLKPENILIAADGVPKIGDFGLSVLDLDDEFRLTGSSQIFGTLPYMAPEQILSSKNVAPASDQYAVGVMLYIVLCKLRPWQDSQPDEQERSRILSNLQSPPPAPTEKDGRADKQLQAICLRCLQPLPENRYPNVKELREALEAWLHADRPVAVKPRRKRTTSLPKSVVVSAAVMMTLVLLGFAASFLLPDGLLSPDGSTTDSTASVDSPANTDSATKPEGNGAPLVVDASKESAADLLATGEWEWRILECFPEFDGKGGDLSADELTLVFSSHRSDGAYGGSDLWMTNRTSIDEPWSDPVNLGHPINTPENQYSPALSPDALAMTYEHGNTIMILRRPSRDAPWGAPQPFNWHSTSSPDLLANDLTRVANRWHGDPSPNQDILIAERGNMTEPWPNPARLPEFINSEVNEHSNGVSEDGRLLLFNRQDQGTMLSTRPSRTAVWGEPVKVPLQLVVWGERLLPDGRSFVCVKTNRDGRHMLCVARLVRKDAPVAPIKGFPDSS